MATILDVGLVSFLSPVFVFLLLFVVFFALLKKINLFGDKSDNLSAVAAFSISLLVVISSPARSIVQSITPMMSVLFVMVFLAFLFFLFLGVKNEDMIAVAKTPGFYTTFIVIFIVIFLVSLTNVFGPIFQVSGNAGFWESTKRVLFSPKVLGALFILLLSSFTVRYLGSTT